MREHYLLLVVVFSLGCRAENGQKALIIGNQHYGKSPLRTSLNDAEAITTGLTGLGFNVTTVMDAKLADIGSAVEKFTNSLKDKDIAVVYYSGHGLQVDGQNYLLPVDFNGWTEADAKRDGYPVARVLDKISAKRTRLKILILDSCRDNLFLASSTLRPGWASMNSSAGTLIAFATAPGSTANDNPEETNGLFAKHLLTELKTSRMNLQALFERVRRDVYQDSNKTQMPWTAPQHP